jgi:RNA polymerase sigma-70 factor (ECF subfamily)
MSDGAMVTELEIRFEREALPCREELLRHAMRMTRHRQDAEDLVQETFMRAWTAFHGFTPGTNIRAWLRRIQLNAFITRYRKDQRQPAILVADAADSGSPRPAAGNPGSTPSAEESFLSRLPATRLVAALTELPAPFRQVLYLIDVEGFSYRETAAIMNTPVGTVMSRVHRGRASLRAALTGSGNGRVFEHGQQGERGGTQTQEVPHVGSDHRRGDSCHRADWRAIHGSQATSPATAIRS